MSPTILLLIREIVPELITLIFVFISKFIYEIMKILIVCCNQNQYVLFITHPFK